MSDDREQSAELSHSNSSSSLDSVERMRIVSDLYKEQQRLLIESLALRYPGDSEDDLNLRAGCVKYGRELVERLTGRTLRW